MTSPPQTQRPWHTLDLATVEQSLEANDRGLTEAEAASRLERFGPNTLPEKKPPAFWQIVLRQFISPLIYILVLAAIVSIVIGDYTDAAFIAAVLAVNAGVGAFQEWKAEQSSRALKKLLQIRATVTRDGDMREISAETVVPGDVIWLEAGNRVPADVRLLNATGLQIDESLLTGESLPVTKDASWQGEEAASVGDRLNMAYAGSIVARGRGTGLTVATGTATNVGQLALDVVGSPGGKTPLIERMERFSNVVAIGTVVIATIIGVLAVVMGRYPISEMFLFVVALAVSAIPEGLPVAMTVALAVGTTRMARRGVIVRRLTAVEGLGSCTLIATDKTGTLTVNELTVREIRLAGGETLDVTGEGFAPHGEVTSNGRSIEAHTHEQLESLIRAAVLCNEGELHERNGEWEWRGDAVDLALLSLGHKLDWRRKSAIDLHPQTHSIPFESELQFAATCHQVGDQSRIYVKGAPERVLAMCNLRDRTDLENAATEMASRGLRVLALAEGDADRCSTPRENLSDLTLLGFVGMIDPLRPGVREAVEACHTAGVQVAMVTGDHPVTALAIARDLGLASDPSQVVNGVDLADKTPEQLAEIVGRVRVFARVAPRQKLQIVEAAQQAGQFVAVTGDGVNDAPALRAANIGVAMGKSGTDVAREAASLVISDDNFTTIVAGIEEGRIAYDDIRKVIFLLLSTGAAELLTVLLTVIAGLPIPLLPIQLLWLNLVTNGIQGVAIAFEPGEPGTLRRKPRSPREGIFNRLMIERMIVSVAFMGTVGFGTFYWLLANGWSEPAARNVLLLLMVLFENFHIGNCRSETRSAFTMSPLRSPMLMFGAIGAFVIHLIGMHVPFFQHLLRTSPVSPTTWLVVILLAVAVVPAMEIHKWTWRMRRRA